MISLLNNRTLELGQSVEVYRNLNRGKLFSIKDRKTGLVVAHADSFRIENVTCKVREGGRQRVIKDKRKNVHATVLGIYTGECVIDTTQMIELYYDPYTLDSFINKNTNEKVHNVDLIYFANGKAYLIQ